MENMNKIKREEFRGTTTVLQHNTTQVNEERHEPFERSGEVDGRGETEGKHE